MKTRRILDPLGEDLEQKMVWIAGPRQCGKTTLAKSLIEEKGGGYYNWDVESHRRILRSSSMNEAEVLWVFDELHKYRGWRNWLKGVYDLHHTRHSILVTGSAKLDVYSRGGDSLQGRYFFHRLHPFTFSELQGLERIKSLGEVTELSIHPSSHADESLKSLLELSGFPEPLFTGSSRKAARWRLSYGTRLVREEIRDLERVRDLDKLEILFERLPETVGSVLSLNSLREDLEVAFESVRSWIQIFEKIYGVFRIAPFGPARIKAVKKEQKLYLWDWARVENESAQFENLIALHLLRFVHWAADVEGEKLELRYFRNTVGQEVDFILLKKGKPWIAIEVKLDDRPLDPSLRYFLERVKTPYAFQVSLKGKKDWRAPDINGCKVRLVPATRFLASLP